MTFQEAKEGLCRKLNIDYTDMEAGNNDMWVDADISYYIQTGVLKAWDYHPWPFTQKTKTATTGVGVPYYNYPSDVTLGSIYLLEVNGNEYKKLAFQDYLAWFQQNPTDNSQLWSENQGYIFINNLAYNQGTDTFDLYGKGLAPALVNPTDLLPFSPTSDTAEYSGNECIVQLAYAEALDSEKKQKYQQAIAERTKAYQTLDMLWKPFNDERQTLQNRNRPQFNVPNFLGQTPPTDAYNFGNFNWP